MDDDEQQEARVHAPDDDHNKEYHEAEHPDAADNQVPELQDEDNTSNVPADNIQASCVPVDHTVDDIQRLQHSLIDGELACCWLKRICCCNQVQKLRRRVQLIEMMRTFLDGIQLEVVACHWDFDVQELP